MARVAYTVTTTDPDHAAQFYLADWHVDTASNRLQRGDTEVKLESKMMEVLIYLAQHRGNLVTREQLDQAIWGKTIVGYEALTGCIAKLRKVLDDDPRRPRYIETISKKGYRLIAPISDVAPHDVSTTVTSNQHERSQYRVPWQRFWLPGLIVIAIVATILANVARQNAIDKDSIHAQKLNLPSIVVLPFSNLGNDPNQHYFSEGVTADITTALSKLSGLFVIAQSSATHYRNKPHDIQKIAASLGVRYVLQGSVRRTGNKLRVNTNLIDAKSNIYLWSEKYDRELKSIFDVQDDITANIVNTLSVKLTEEELRRTARKYTISLDAYEDFLRGQLHYIRHTEKDNQLARDYYQQAIDRDPSFARAYSAMALTYVAEHRYDWDSSTNGQLEHALRLAAQGVFYDNELPQAHWVQAYVHVFRHEYDNASEAANRAIELDPNFADSYLTLAVCQIYFGKPEDALHLIRKAMLLNPNYPAAYASVLGQAYFFREQYDLAIPVLRKAIERNNNLLTSHVFLIAALSKLEKTDEAVWAANHLRVVSPDFTTTNVDELLPVQHEKIIVDIKKHLQSAGL